MRVTRKAAGWARRLRDVAVEHSGRLELTWTNKHLRLLSNEDGGYTWVPPSDYRVAARGSWSALRARHA